LTSVASLQRKSALIRESFSIRKSVLIGKSVLTSVASLQRESALIRESFSIRKSVLIGKSVLTSVASLQRESALIRVAYELPAAPPHSRHFRSSQLFRSTNKYVSQEISFSGPPAPSTYVSQEISYSDPPKHRFRRNHISWEMHVLGDMKSLYPGKLMCWLLLLQKCHEQQASSTRTRSRSSVSNAVCCVVPSPCQLPKMSEARLRMLRYAPLRSVTLTGTGLPDTDLQAA